MTAERWDIVYLPLGAATCGGAERSILELAAAQRAAGRSVLVAYEAALAATDFPALAAAAGVPLRPVAWRPEDRLADVAAAAWRFFRGIEATVVHFNISWRPHMWCVPLVARLASRAKLVGTMRAMPEPFSDLPSRRHFGVIPGLKLWAWPDYVIGRVWARTLHRTVSVNRDDYPPRLVRAFGFARSRLSTIYNGVRIPPQPPSADDRADARRAFGLAEGDFVVAYVGRVSPEKGVRYLLQALAGSPPHWKLVIAGEGSDLEPVRALARELGLAERVQFRGYVSPATPVFTAADVVVVPSLWNEAFGRVVVEAMACGAAVVASAVGGMQEIFESGREGLLVPRADAAAIRQALSTLDSDRSALARIASAGYAHAAATFSTRRVSEQYSQLYATLADRHA